MKQLLAMKRKGNDLSQQLYILKDENERLRELALNYNDIERMKQENKQMRIELQKLRLAVNSDGASDLSPDSISAHKSLRLRNLNNDA